jgi:hypothetical protein
VRDSERGQKVPRINVFHNVSRDASFGFNSVFRTGDSAPEGARAIQLSDGRWTWKDSAQTEDERHELVWVFSYEADEDSPEALLETAWERFNNGSGREDAAYFARRLRSLSKGDVVFVGSQPWSCESVGWAQRNLSELRTLAAAQAEQVIRSRYEITAREELTVTVPLAD